MNLHSPQFSATDVLQVAKIDHNTLQNWLRRGLLDRLGTSRPEGSWRQYSLMDVVTVTAEAQLAFLGVTPKARNGTGMAEKVASRCLALICKMPIEHTLTFSPPHDLGVKIVIDCRQLADEVLSALHTRS